MLTKIVNKIPHFFLQLLIFDYARFVWSMRSMLAAIICLLLSFYFSNQGLWLISSSVMILQLYAYGGSFCSKTVILAWSLLLALSGATIAIFSGSLFVLWGTIVSLICLTFYFSHQGTDRALVGLWSTALVMINAFFPIDEAEWFGRVSPLLVGVVIAYVMLFIKIPRRKKDKILTLLQHFLIPFQNYMENVFTKILFEGQPGKNSQTHDEARDALFKLRNLPVILEYTYNIKHAETKMMLEGFYLSYTNIFYWLVAMERFQAVTLPSEVKFSLEHLHVSFQSLSHSLSQSLLKSSQHGFFEMLDQRKTIESMHYLLNKVEDVSQNLHMTLPQQLGVSGIYYVLRKLAHELEIFVTFLEGATAKNSIAYLNREKE